MTANRATGADDPALAETVWSLPSDDPDVEWQLRYGKPTKAQMLESAEVLSTYRALIEDGTTKQQLRRLAALRRVHRRRSRR